MPAGSIPNPAVAVPSREALLAAFKGKKVSDVQTPHLVIDQTLFVENCRRMRNAVNELGWDFRAHIKTHKTAEGTRLQCVETGTKRIIVSTLPEAYAVIDAGLIQDGTVTDMLYSMPLPLRLFDPLSKIKSELEKHGATLRLMIDNPAQIYGLAKAVKESGKPDQVWSIYLKMDIGNPRAGLPAHSEIMKELITAILTTPSVSLFGTYTHAGFSYASKDGQTAADILAREVAGANEGAKVVFEMAKTISADVHAKLQKQGLRLAVGATPTAHAAGPEWAGARDKAGIGRDDLIGEVELHAGCYCLLDTQQCATSLVHTDVCAMRVGATIISQYPHRQEALCDAGAICMSKDVGPIPGFGPVIAPQRLADWHLQRNSQEHGILARKSSEAASAAGGKLTDDFPRVEEYVQIIPQHACLTAAQHPWFLITENGGEEVIDVWVPCKGW